MSRRTEALRNLAERPGTEAEGAVARAMLAKLQDKEKPETREELLDRWFRYRDDDDLAAAVKMNLTCECGTEYAPDTKCGNHARHRAIEIEKLRRFPKGTRVYYNRWAYRPDCPGVVVGPAKTWNWIRIKFDHLKQARNVPIYDNKWFLSTEPVYRRG